MTDEHGGNIYAHEAVLDFSANLNPLGMPESVKKAVLASAHDWEHYPDPNCTELINKLSVHEKIPAHSIVCGNGADDLIYRAVHGLRPKKAVVTAPAFSEYEKALREVDCQVCTYFLEERDGFVLDEGILEALDESTDMLIICSPNNPIGRIIPKEVLRKISTKCREEKIILICDECFLGFVENGCEYSLQNWFNEACVVLKAFTKLYAMAGLRLGYALCGDEEIAKKIKNSGQFWSVSVPAQEAGLAALDEIDYVKKTLMHIKKERAFLADRLDKLGIKVYPSEANFLLLKTEVPLAERLLSEGILIRSCSNYKGLGDGFYRIAVRTHEENMRLIYAVGRCVNG